MKMPCPAKVTDPAGQWRWGAPAHLEPVSACLALISFEDFHADDSSRASRTQAHIHICDTTVWRLHGRQKVTLFPPHQWPNLHPFDANDDIRCSRN